MLVTNLAGLPADRFEPLRSAVSLHTSLIDAIEFARGSNGKAPIPNVVVQDEYSYDVVIPAGDGIHLVYQTT